MNTCSTCAHWERERPTADGMAVCKSNYLTEPGGYFTDGGGAPDVEIRGLRYSYDEGGAFYTGPEFGCVHWATLVTDLAAGKRLRGGGVG